MEPQDKHEPETQSSQSPPSPNGGSAETATAPDTQELERLQADLNEAQAQMLRAQAELDNFRKRIRRDMEEERRFAAAPLLRDLFPALDNLERAVEAAGKNEGAAGLVDGVIMVVQQIGQILEQHGCRRIPAKGEAFDPHVHEAITQQPSDEHPAGVVMLETRSGYQLHDRVLRPAQVIISSGPPRPQEET
ncbi:MAG: nucleotide exchange factor GrpE [Planctomycetes bacterium]|nr:nucleotide exchange factor GrpE [Planctomycetota bacterium]